MLAFLWGQFRQFVETRADSDFATSLRGFIKSLSTTIVDKTLFLLPGTLK